MLNEDWIKRIKLIKEILETRFKLEEEKDLSLIHTHTDYNHITTLRTEKIIPENFKRRLSIEPKKVSESIAEKEFAEAYGEKFDEVSKIIDDLVTKYEEAINFGDLEIVKKLYYIMKDSDDFFKSISNLEI